MEFDKYIKSAKKFFKQEVKNEKYDIQFVAGKYKVLEFGTEKTKHGEKMIIRLASETTSETAWIWGNSFLLGALKKISNDTDTFIGQNLELVFDEEKNTIVLVE